MDAAKLWLLFSTFLKINLVSPSGPASLGIVYEQSVPRLISEEQFVQVASFSRILPGSDALQMAVFIGYSAAGWQGALVATAAAILPPTIIMLSLAMVLSRIRGEQWISGFVQGVTPALAALMLMIAIDLVREDIVGNWGVVLIAGISLIALLLRVSPVLVLLIAGGVGILLYR